MIKNKPRFLEPLLPDGSDRRFYRGAYEDGRSCIVMHPDPGEAGLREALSYVSIGRHLKKASVPVPEIYDFDAAAGIIIMEDLGDIYLQTEIKRLADAGDWLAIKRLYMEALSVLAAMGVRGGEGFDPAWCFDIPYYDSELAFQKEALYFLNAFLGRRMGLEWSLELEAGLKDFSCLIDEMPQGFFLHRDFQSRNLLVCRSSLRVIDFQGGRLGPLGYDAASLLFDPYVALPFDVIWGLFDCYVNMLGDLGVAPCRDEFRRNFKILSLFRLMQALGAYSFLGVVKGKAFFLDYIPGALSSLAMLLDDEAFKGLYGLEEIVNKIMDDNMRFSIE
jgi:aminoglycoside/choline kinase family phosphotransferase